jgi:nitrous oxidase accessory protein
MHSIFDKLAALFFRAAGVGVLALLVFAPNGKAYAASVIVKPGDGTLAGAISAARAGDTLTLQNGRYFGPILIDKPLKIMGAPGTIIDGRGQRSVVMVSAPDVVLSGLTIVNSGNNLARENAAIFVNAKGSGVLIENNRLKGDLTGIFLKGPHNALVRGNKILGSTNFRMSERGNGFYVWNSPGTIIENNDVLHGRDGIFVMTSKNNIFRNNTFRDLRFAIHYMYTNHSEVSGNRSINNDIGYAIMFSDHLKISGNLSLHDRQRAFLFNFANRSAITDNVARGGSKKCVFIYDSNRNIFRGNTFEDCAIGIHFTAGSEYNVITGNAFINNRNQVKYVGTRYVEWSVNGRGNYWSDNASFDLNGDGISDRPYHPNGLVDQVVWRHPLARLLLNSPAVQILRWAQSEFPSIRPGGVTDSAPLMTPPPMRAFRSEPQ